MVGRLLSFWDDLFSGAMLVSGGVMVEMLSSFSWQLHSQKMQAISICTTINRLEIQPFEFLVIFHCIPAMILIIPNAMIIYLHDFLVGQNKNNQPITSDFPSFPRVNPSSEGSTHGAALGGWTRAGSAPSVSASRGAFRGRPRSGLFDCWVPK